MSQVKSRRQARKTIISLPEIETSGTRAITPTDILFQVGETLEGGADLRDTLDRLAMLALRATGAERCAVFLAEDDGQRLVPVAGAAHQNDSEELGRRFREAEPIRTVGGRSWELLSTRPGPLVIEEVGSSPLIPEWWKVWGSRSMALAVLRAHGVRSGLLAVDYVTQIHPFSVEEVRLLDAIASAAGIALHAARSAEREARSHALQRHLLACSAAIQSGRSLPEALDLIVDGFSLFPRIGHVTVFLLDERREVLRAVASRGSEVTLDDIVVSRLPPAGVAYAQHIWGGDPRQVILLPQMRPLADWGRLLPPEVDHALVLALHDSVELLGLVVLGSDRDGWDDAELSAARALCDQIASAVSFARMNEERLARQHLIETIFGVSDLVAGSVDFRALVKELNQWMRGRVGLECAELGFADPVLSELLKLPPLSQEATACLRRWRKARTIAKTSPQLSPERVGDRSVLPIMVDRRVAGAFVVRARNRLREDEMALVRVLAAGIGEAALRLKLRHSLERRSQEVAVSVERDRIATDLHDTVGQTFYGIALGLDDVLEDVADPDVAERLTTLRAHASQGIADIRSAIYSLSNIDVNTRGLVPSLRALAKRFTLTTRIGVSLRIEKGLPKVSEDTEGALYRTALEALTNVDRHARATGVVLSLSHQGSSLVMEIQDDGVGLDQRVARDWRAAAHFGLRSVERRVQEVGGTLDARPTDPRGLLIEARVPLRAPGD